MGFARATPVAASKVCQSIHGLARVASRRAGWLPCRSCIDKQRLSAQPKRRQPLSVAVSQDAPAGQRTLAGDRPLAPSRLPNVPDAWKQLVQLHGRREFAALLVGGADHGSPRFGDDQHLQTMGYADRRVQAFVVKVLRPSPRRETDWQLDDWPEKSARETRWFDPGDAVELVGEGGLAEIIKMFRRLSCQVCGR
jgi:hypothetical protein